MCACCGAEIRGSYLVSQCAAGQRLELVVCSVACSEIIGTLGGWVVAWRVVAERVAS